MRVKRLFTGLIEGENTGEKSQLNRILFRRLPHREYFYGYPSQTIQTTMITSLSVLNRT